MFSKNRLHQELKEATNMKAVELRAWLRTDIAPLTVANYDDAPSMDQSNKLLVILMKDSEDLTKADCLFIQSILQRIKYIKNTRSNVQHTKLDWENSLRNLGFDVKKKEKSKKKEKEFY
ncbi:DUF3140 domain-containing protein [Leeuwenhoekiella sp. NPDC079379]|uniref:DUF3140 domain-containing protein n=1 Tax=Leeuwenhoekiella sp. NPDC079379 TaxID=3364122 RepID=UPI0037C7A9EF